MEKTRYKPSDASKLNEDAVKRPLIEEHNLMGAKFRDEKISPKEWKTFKEDWLKRFNSSMNNVVKDRIYVEDISIEDIS